MARLGAAAGNGNADICLNKTFPLPGRTHLHCCEVKVAETQHPGSRGVYGFLAAGQRKWGSPETG